MNARSLSLGICGRGPIEEAIFYRYAAVCGDEPAEIMKQFGYVCVLFFEIFEVSVMYESVVMNKQPPKRICGNAVHNIRQGSVVPYQVKAFAHAVAVSENILNSRRFRVHIAYPNESVALHAVPDIFLHIELHRVSGGLPYIVKTLVVTFECAEIIEVSVLEFCADAFYGKFNIVKQVDSDKTETRISYFRHSEPTEQMNIVAHGVVICRILLAAKVRCGISHALHRAFAEADADTGGVVAVMFPDVCNYLYAALHFKPEVKQNKAVFFQYAGVSSFESCLRRIRREQYLRLFREL